MELEATSLVERTRLLAGAKEFASYVANKWTQVDENVRVIYYFTGSLAIMLLAQATSMMRLDSSMFPRVFTVDSIPLAKDVNDGLSLFARKINDVDFVPTDVHSKMLEEANAYYPSDVKKYNELRNKILTKGGGGPSIEELPQLAREVYDAASGQVKVMCDPVPHYGQHQVVSIKVNGSHYLISDPKLIFGYKVLHLMQSFSQKPQRLKRDFAILHEALRQLYPGEELIRSAYGVIVRFEDAMTKYQDAETKRHGIRARTGMHDLANHPDFNSVIKPFFDELRRYDKGKRDIL